MEKFIAKRRSFLIYLSVFTLVSVVFLTIYVAVQQNYRQSANDPQIQMAEDAVASLDNGGAFQSVILPMRVDIATSLSVFTTVFNDAGQPIGSSGYLQGGMPTLPPGVFDYVRSKGESRFTWQPEKGVRDAVVVTKYSGGFVMVGRSIREVEKREEALFSEVFAGWIVSILIAGFCCVVAIAKGKGMPTGMWITRIVRYFRKSVE
jgi:hypothetical protein